MTQDYIFSGNKKNFQYLVNLSPRTFAREGKKRKEKSFRILFILNDLIIKIWSEESFLKAIPANNSSCFKLRRGQTFLLSLSTFLFYQALVEKSERC